MVAVVLALELLLEPLPLLLPLPGVVDEGLVLLPALLSVLPLLLPPSVLPAFWSDGIIDGMGVLLLPLPSVLSLLLLPPDVVSVLLLLSLLLLPPSLLLLSGVVVGGGGVLLLLLLLLLLPPSLLLLSLVSFSDIVDSDGGMLPMLSPLSTLASLVSFLDFEPVRSPSLLLSSAAVDGVGAPSDLSLFFVLLVPSESVVGGTGREANVLLLPVLLSLCLPLSLSLFVLVSDVVVVDGDGILLLPPSVLGVGGTASVSVVLSSDFCLFFIESSEDGGGHFPFTGIESSGQGTDREASVLPPLLLSSALLDVVPPPSVSVVLSSDLLFFAPKTVKDPSNVKAIVVMDETRIKIVNIVII